MSHFFTIQRVAVSQLLLLCNIVYGQSDSAYFISTVAGNGVRGFSGDGGPATAAQLLAPEGLAIDIAGDLYIAEPNNNRIRRVSPAGIMSTTAGRGGGG